ncbi:MAG: primary-amine oxidase [Acidimicrobiales bacterium]
MAQILDPSTATAAPHPLDRLSEAETGAAVGLIKADGRFGPRMRFASVNLHEPGKDQVLSFRPGDPVHRAAEAILLDTSDGSTHEVTASITGGAVTGWNRITGVQPSLILDEMAEVQDAVRADPAFRAAMARRGITDMDLVTVDPWSAGHYGDPVESDHRIIRGLVWIHGRPGDNQYARPVDGLTVIADLLTMTVLRVDDERLVTVPAESGDWVRELTGPTRSDVKPLEITQPEGPSFTVTGDRLEWQKWSLRLGWTSREGLVINTVTYDDDGEVRPVLYRASLAEMTVPYGDPSSTQARKNAFDVGEYGFGMLANSLTLGCDCLGEIHYLDAHGVDAAGEVLTIAQAICIHEEDFGIAWKHVDTRIDAVEVRRLRRLVVSFIATVGNYEYGIYWYFYQDGRIENEIKLTGILSTAAIDDGDTTEYGTMLAPNLYGPNHQHFFCVRIDPMIDGLDNTVVEVDTVPAPVDENPWGNAFLASSTVLASEQQARRLVDPLVARYWKVVSGHRTNRMGGPTGYKLLAGENCLPFATETSSIRRRAGYMWNHLWVTPYTTGERYPAGEYPNQSPGGDGLPSWTEADRPVENTDVVLWYVMGHNHLPSPEDWPVMPVACIGFTLKPTGFFDHSPAMDLPPSDHCH